MTEPTPLEQLTLELINQFRMDPQGEYDRLVHVDVIAQIQAELNFFNVNMTALENALGLLNPVAPLAWNSNLADAAQGHNAQMIAFDTQSHQLPGEDPLNLRVENAGYTGWNALAENVYAFGESGFHGHAGFVIDWGYDDVDFEPDGMGGVQLKSNWQSLGDGMQDPPGHRNALISASFAEIGIAITEENNNATNVGPLVITHNLGNRFAYKAQFVGVVINDTDNDDFYDIGEGMGGVTVTLTGTAGTFMTTTWASGGYQIEVPAGTYTITFSGGGLSGTIQVVETLGTANVKVDVEAADATGGGGGNTVTGDGGDNRLRGTIGIDTINALGGADILLGFGDDDILNGHAGNDILIGGLGNDTMVGGTGDDIYVVEQVGDVVTENPGEGTDEIRTVVNYTLPDNVENLRLAGAAASGTGNALANTILGGSQAATLAGMDGDDIITGSNLNDTITGGNGADVIAGRGGNDVINGGTGNDTINGGASVDTIYGVAGDDILRGDEGNDTLFGGNDNDTLFGGSASDTLDGGNGTDTLNGEDGVDTLIGGAGQDFMTGGLRADDFVFDEDHFAGLTAATADRILDFSQAQGDDIDLSLVDAIAGGGDDAFTFIGNAAFSGSGGEVRFENVAGYTMVYLETTGDTTADYAIRLNGTHVLTQADFIL